MIQNADIIFHQRIHDSPTTDSVEPPPAPQSFDSPTCGNGRKTNRVAKGSPWVSGFLVDTAASPAKAAAPWAPRRGSHFSRFGGGRLGPRRFWKEARAEGRAAAGEGSSPGNRRAGPRPAGAGPVTGDRPRQRARRRGGWAGGRSAHGCKKASRCPRLDACAAPANRKSGPREPGERSRSPCWGWREKGDSAYYASRQPPRQEAGAAAYYASREPPRQEAGAASYYASREPPRRAGGASVTREAEVEAEPTWVRR